MNAYSILRIVRRDVFNGQVRFHHASGEILTREAGRLYYRTGCWTLQGHYVAFMSDVRWEPIGASYFDPDLESCPIQKQNSGKKCAPLNGDGTDEKSPFTEEQIVFALKQGELGTRVSEVCVGGGFPMPHSLHGARKMAAFRPQN